MDPQHVPLSPGDHVIVCGLGHVGVRIVDLLARLGCRGVVITRSAVEEWRLALAPGFTVLLGDARESTLLRQAGITQARAVLGVTNDDAANVSIALEARRLNPRATIVARLFDRELAGHLEGTTGIDRLLSASALAAPAFLAAALGGGTLGSFESEGQLFIVDEAHAPASTTETVAAWQSRTGHAVVALARGEHTRPSFPPPESTLQPGDRLTCIRAAHTLHNTAARTKPSFVHNAHLALRDWWRNAPRPLRVTLVALLAVVALSIGVFRFGLGLSTVDALYFVITTITTVGYGDINLLNASDGLKLYGAFVMLCGAAIIAVLFGVVTDGILNARFRGVLARNHETERDHIIVVGLDNIGRRLVSEFARAGVPVVVVDTAEGPDAALVRGRARDPDTLRRAGLAGARAVVAATDDQLANLGIGLAAKKANPAARAVVRLYDSLLAERLHGQGVDAALSVSAAAAPAFVGAACCPGCFGGLVVGDSLLLLFRRPVTGDGAAPLAADERALWFIRPEGRPFAPAATPEPQPAGTTLVGCRLLPLAARSVGP
jgi:Trk K+ transport system NAD-binding subunit